MLRVAALAIALCASPALAGDMNWPADAQMGATDWSGGYLGAFGGVAVSNGRAERGAFGGPLITLDVQNGLFPASIDGSEAGMAAGALAGINFQSGAFVGGLEADFGYVWTDVRNSFSRVDPNPNPIFNGVDTNTSYVTEFGGLGTLRARGGYAFDRILVFASAGVAAGNVTNRFTLDLPQLGYTSPDWSDSGMRFGYALSVGIEYRMTDRLSLRFETLYANLADTTVDAVDNVTFPGETISYDFSNDVIIPRLALTAKF